MCAQVGKPKSRQSVATNYTWPLELVWLKDIEEEDLQDQRFPWSFVLVGPLKTYTLKFATKEEKMQWINVIRVAVKKALTAENAPGTVVRSQATSAKALGLRRSHVLRD